MSRAALSHGRYTRTRRLCAVLAKPGGMRVAKAKGRLRGKKPKLIPATEGHPVAEFHSGDYSVHELARRHEVDVATVHRAVERAEKSGAAAAVTLTLSRADSDAQ